jgi:hypothetical protein
LAHAANSATRLVRISRILELLADELALGRPGPAYSLLRDADGLIAQGRRTWGFDDQRLLLLDGTANPEIMRQFVPQLQDVPEIRVQRNARIIQVQGFEPSVPHGTETLFETVPFDLSGPPFPTEKALADPPRIEPAVAMIRAEASRVAQARNSASQ